MGSREAAVKPADRRLGSNARGTAMEEPQRRYDPSLGARIWLFVAILVVLAVIAAIIEGIH